MTYYSRAAGVANIYAPRYLRGGSNTEFRGIARKAPNFGNTNNMLFRG